MTGCAIHELLEALFGPCTAANLLDPTPAPYSLTSCENEIAQCDYDDNHTQYTTD